MNASFIGGIIAVVVILLIIAVIKTYNHMVVLRNRVDNQGAQIEVQLKRRADLIPNLLETTKGYAHYEQETLSKITELRMRLLPQNLLKPEMHSAGKFPTFLLWVNSIRN